MGRSKRAKKEVAAMESFEATRASPSYHADATTAPAFSKNWRRWPQEHDDCLKRVCEAWEVRYSPSEPKSWALILELFKKEYPLVDYSKEDMRAHWSNMTKAAKKAAPKIHRWTAEQIADLVTIHDGVYAERDNPKSHVNWTTIHRRWSLAHPGVTLTTKQLMRQYENTMSRRRRAAASSATSAEESSAQDSTLPFPSSPAATNSAISSSVTQDVLSTIRPRRGSKAAAPTGAQGSDSSAACSSSTSAILTGSSSRPYGIDTMGINNDSSQGALPAHQSQAMSSYSSNYDTSHQDESLLLEPPLPPRCTTSIEHGFTGQSPPLAPSLMPTTDTGADYDDSPQGASPEPHVPPQAQTRRKTRRVQPPEEMVIDPMLLQMSSSLASAAREQASSSSGPSSVSPPPTVFAPSGRPYCPLPPAPGYEPQVPWSVDEEHQLGRIIRKYAEEPGNCFYEIRRDYFTVFPDSQRTHGAIEGKVRNMRMTPAQKMAQRATKRAYEANKTEEERMAALAQTAAGNRQRRENPVVREWENQVCRDWREEQRGLDELAAARGAAAEPAREWWEEEDYQGGFELECEGAD